jgi:lambda family phage portal protein
MSKPLPKQGFLSKFMTWASGKSINIPDTTPKQPTNYYSGSSHRYSGTRSTGSKYPGALSRRVEGVTFDHWSIRQNARDATFDNPQAASIVERFVDSVIDQGLRVEFTPKYKLLGISEEEAIQWAEDHEERFDLYMRSKQSHIAESLTGYQIQRQYARFQQRDNDIFVRFHYSKRSDLISPLQLGFLDPNQIRGDEFTSTYGPTQQDDGIIRDDNGKEKGYKVWRRDKKSGGYKFVEIPATGPRSKRTMMIHGYDPLYAGQGRGLSRLYHALTEFEKLTDFSLAKIMNAINQSNYTMYVKPSQDNPASDPTEGMPNSGPRGQRVVDSGEEPCSGSGNIVDYCTLPEATQDTPGSTAVFSLQEGEDLKFLENKVQGDDYQTFVSAFTSYLSASMGMPIEVLLMKFNANYSASRASLVMFWRICKIWRQETDADLMTPWIQSWLSEEIAAGRTQAPGWSDPRLKAAWMCHNLIGAPMPNIDPAKEAKAHKEMLDISATTQERISRETNGTSAKDNIAINKRAFKQTPVGPWNSSNNVTEEPEEEEEQEND